MKKIIIPLVLFAFAFGSCKRCYNCGPDKVCKGDKEYTQAQRGQIADPVTGNNYNCTPAGI